VGSTSRRRRGPVDTPLRRHLSGACTTRPGPLDALRQAQHLFQTGQRIDMQGLAIKIGVDRATLYRWAGSREHLLAEVLWAVMNKTVQRLRVDAAVRGGPAAADIVAGAARTISNTGTQTFLEREGVLALKLLTTNASDFQQRLIPLIGDDVHADRRAGHLHAVVPAEDLPFLLVRVMESYIYVTLITGDEPNAERASRVLHYLLPTSPRGPSR